MNAGKSITIFLTRFFFLACCGPAFFVASCDTVDADLTGVYENAEPPAGADTVSWYHHSLETVPGNDVAGQINALNGLGEYYLTHYRYDSVIDYYTRSFQLAERVDSFHLQVKALEKIATVYVQLLNDDSALVYLNRALVVSRKGQRMADIGLALQELGIFYFDQRSYDTALTYFKEELPYDVRLKDSLSISGCLSNMATIYLQQGEYDSSIAAYKRAIVISELRNDDISIAQYSTNLGIAYKERGLYDTAMRYLVQAARLFDLSKSPKQQSTCYTTIGNMQLELGNTQEALDYHTQALRLRQSIDYKKGIGSSLNNVGEVYIKMEQYDTALVYLKRALIIKEELGDKALIASTLDLLGEVSYLRKDFKNAEDYYLQSLELKKAIENPKEKALTLNHLGELYNVWGKPALALDALEDSRKILEQTGAKNALLENYAISSEVLRSQGNLKEAFAFDDKHDQLMDTVLDERKNKAIIEMETKYETEKKEQEIMVLNEREAVQAKVVDQQHKLIYALVAGAILLIAVIGLLFYAFRSRQKALRQEQVMKHELHHRIKNNLQVLSGLLELQQSRISDEGTRELMQAIDQRLTAMLLIHQGLYGNRVASHVNMQDYIRSLVANLSSSFGYSMEQLNIRFSVMPLKADADRALSLGFICNEIVSNWFKHVLKNNPGVSLLIELNPDMFCFTDNGPGMPPEINDGPGASFGLRLIKLFAEELNATLTISSGIAGTTIKLQLSEKIRA